MSADPLAAAVQARAAAVVGEQIGALTSNRLALLRWTSRHGVVDAGPGAVLAVLARDLRGGCGVCTGLGEFINHDSEGDPR